MENALTKIVEKLKLKPECLAPDVSGMTSPRVRMLLNLLVGMLPPDEMYFEVGCYKGATFISALLDHPSAQAVACDNWSQFQPDTEPTFRANLEKYKPRLPKINMLAQDCFTIPSNPENPFQSPIGVYFYDGYHTYDSQLKAITSFAPFLSKQCIIIIDDWNWTQVRNGTWAGINTIRPLRVDFFELTGR